MPFIQKQLIEREIDGHYATEPISHREMSLLKKQLLHDLAIYQKGNAHT
ncbi:MAG TPA: hypothetical protein VGS08_02455 [Candidatus Saccharimonadales bacterium]|nr:hypothetical protein [Candidatus Saccharimonadales bacterium]